MNNNVDKIDDNRNYHGSRGTGSFIRFPSAIFFLYYSTNFSIFVLFELTTPV